MYNNDLFKFITASPTAFHTASVIAARLDDAGFVRLRERDNWRIARGGRYYVTRNGSSVVAFSVGSQLTDGGFNAVISHTDSPTFKLKENPLLEDGYYTRLDTERYGGAIDHTWFDRPLSVAGRVTVLNGARLETRLVKVDRESVIIPSVAIHMNREVNNGFKINEQIDTIPLFCQGADSGAFKRMIADAAECEPDSIMSTELMLYTRVPPCRWGSEGEFISSPRLDNLQCAYSTLMGFIQGKNSKTITVYGCFDNEEVGSRTKQGANSPFLADTLSRISIALGRTREEHMMAIANSYMLSADNSHAVHPNHPEHSDSANRPVMNGGPVVKVNAGQAYATDAHASAIFRLVCKNADVPVQSFANRSDKKSGGTIGNITASHIGILTADVGLAQLAMHSAYETAGALDTNYMVSAVKQQMSSSIRSDGDDWIVE